MKINETVQDSTMSRLRQTSTIMSYESFQDCSYGGGIFTTKTKSLQYVSYLLDAKFGEYS